MHQSGNIACRPGQNSENIFLYKTHTRLAKNNFPIHFCVFLPTLKRDISSMKTYLKKYPRRIEENCLKISNLF